MSEPKRKIESSNSASQRPDYYEFTYDMFIGSVDGEESEISRFQTRSTPRSPTKCMPTKFRASKPSEPKSRRNVPMAYGSICSISASYNYLGYAQHPEVISAAKAALDEYGLGACSSPVQAGTLGLHTILEKRLADFIGAPNLGVSLFSSGYGVNTGTISAIMKRGHHIVIDKSSHMSIVEESARALEASLLRAQRCG